MGDKLNNPNTSRKSYWKTINKVTNKCKAPKIPPLLINNLFILNCREKAKLFTGFFSQQHKPVINYSDGISGQMLLLCDDSVILPLFSVIYYQLLFIPTSGNLLM